MKTWESEKHRRWGMQVEGFRGQVTTDASLMRKTGKWGACGWAVVQLEYDEEMGPLHGMYGSVEAEFEVQRTIKRAELTAFLYFLKKVIDPSRCMSITKELLMGYGEEKETASSREREMQICG